jgi:glycerophosphoryl diester phosphodiesterase
MTPLYIAAGAFYVLYKLLEFFPWVVRTPYFLGQRGLAQKIGHRGSRDEGLPENSKAAFVDACMSGAEIIEVKPSNVYV